MPPQIMSNLCIFAFLFFISTSLSQNIFNFVENLRPIFICVVGLCFLVFRASYNSQNSKKEWQDQICQYNLCKMYVKTLDIVQTRMFNIERITFFILWFFYTACNIAEWLSFRNVKTPLHYQKIWWPLSW